METKIINVTPKLAREWLTRNTRNRKLRPSHVERLRASFARGEYRMTHQGIAFSDSGVLIDGQHRLSAIALLPDEYEFPFLVATGLQFDEAFQVVDAVGVGRSAADIMGLDRKMVEVGAFICRLVSGVPNATPTQIAPYVEFSLPVAQELNAFCGTTSKTWSAVSVRAAAVVSIMQGRDADYVKLMYRSLVLADFALMTPVVTSLFRSHLTGKVRATERNDLFVRCMKAFNPANSNLVKIQIKDAAAEISAIREWALQAAPMKKAPAKAGAKVSKAQADSTLPPAILKAMGRIAE